MKKHSRLLLLMVASVTLFTGCPQKKLPSPTDTVVNTGIVQSKDYIVDGESNGINPQAAGSLSENMGNSENLSLRDSQLNAAGTEGSPYAKEDVLCSVYYNFDESAIAPQERPVLDQIAQKLKEDPSLRVLVAGHCDWYGTAEYNLALGEQRAKGVVHYLSDLGIDASRFETLSLGSREATPQLSKEEAHKDRRSDIVQLKNKN